MTKEYTEQEQAYYDSLVKLREQLLVEVAGITNNSLKANHNAGEELADIGSDHFNRDMNLSLMGQEANELKMIDAALKRLEDGSFGVCLDTGKQIQERRLKAIPFATRCIEAQEEYERKKAMGIA